MLLTRIVVVRPSSDVASITFGSYKLYRCRYVTSDLEPGDPIEGRPEEARVNGRSLVLFRGFTDARYEESPRQSGEIGCIVQILDVFSIFSILQNNLLNGSRVWKNERKKGS